MAGLEFPPKIVIPTKKGGENPNNSEKENTLYDELPEDPLRNLSAEVLKGFAKQITGIVSNALECARNNPTNAIRKNLREKIYCDVKTIFAPIIFDEKNLTIAIEAELLSLLTAKISYTTNPNVKVSCFVNSKEGGEIYCQVNISRF